ncbi:MAG: rhomboid family intramembrane serine protease [Flavobacteriaceae bacterium]|nr:MAG: rhomboid family intramembrane serine protease [Flavobacteriaceae bacterium]
MGKTQIYNIVKAFVYLSKKLLLMFPIGDDNVKGGPFPFFSYLFILINVLVYFVIEVPALTSDSTATLFFEQWAGQACELSKGESLITLLTSIFLHGSLMHLGGNMIFLWVFGDNIESTIGNLKFAFFYLVGGVIATYTHVFLAGATDCTPLVGASGSIAAVLGAYLVMFPKSRIKLWFILFSYKISAIFFLGFWLIQQFSGIGVKDIPGGGDNVAYWAHIGGFVFGIIAGFLFKGTTRLVMLENGEQEYHTLAYQPHRYNNRVNLAKFFKG